MCGVTGWVDFERDLREEGATAQAMTDTLLCRGPDGHGLWQDRRVALGHTRMAVIDLGGGRQPMVAERDGRPVAVITYCSEVYNYKELRTELIARGHSFRTESDTEVVLAAYLEWGDDFAARLNGMYAFAIWDIPTQSLVMVRDRVGVKPLYYYPTPHGILFGSEPKAIIANPLARKVVDADGLRELLSLAKTPGAAAYRGMHEVRPGEIVRFSRAGLTTRRYWSLEPRRHTDDLAATIVTIRDLLEDIVGRQLVSDVPLCTLLSGGLDSSVVTALAARALGTEKVRTFSLDFEGYTDNFRPQYMRDAPDQPYVREMASHVAAEHTDIVLSTADLLDPAVRAAVLAAHDLPFGRGDRDTSLYLLCREVRRRSTVALTGESADEVFGGYSWFHGQPVDAFPWLPMFGHPLDDGAGSSGSVLDRGLLADLDLPGYRDAAYRIALAEAPLPDWETAQEHQKRRLCHMTLTRLLPLLLDRMDRMSMANALEVRVPFLDHRLIEYVYNTPWSMKTFDGREKSLLRAAARDILPPSVAQRRKAPFPATQDVAYEKAIRAELASLPADAPVMPLLDRERLIHVAEMGGDSSNEERSHVELALRLNAWLETGVELAL